MTREEVNQILNKLCEYGGMMLDWQYVEAIKIAAIFYETGEDTATKEGKQTDSDDIWKYDNEGAKWSIPKEVTDEEINYSNIIFGVCECKLPSHYAHVFKKSEHPNGIIDYICVYCGTGGQLLFNPPSSDS